MNDIIKDRLGPLLEELGIEKYVLVVKDPDTDIVHDMYGGGTFWVSGAITFAEERVRQRIRCEIEDSHDLSEVDEDFDEDDDQL